MNIDTKPPADLNERRATIFQRVADICLAVSVALILLALANAFLGWGVAQ